MIKRPNKISWIWEARIEDEEEDDDEEDVGRVSLRGGGLRNVIGGRNLTFPGPD